MSSRYELGPYSFEHFSAVCVSDGDPAIPNRAAVYAIATILPPATRALLNDGTPSVFTYEGQSFHHTYTGESYAARNRLAEHFFGTVEQSNFRHTLLSLSASGYGPLDQQDCNEAHLTSWLLDNSRVGILEVPYIGDVEREIIRATRATVNIVGTTKNARKTAIQTARKNFPVKYFL